MSKNEKIKINSDEYEVICAIDDIMKEYREVASQVKIFSPDLDKALCILNYHTARAIKKKYIFNHKEYEKMKSTIKKLYENYNQWVSRIPVKKGWKEMAMCCDPVEQIYHFYFDKQRFDADALQVGIYSSEDKGISIPVQFPNGYCGILDMDKMFSFPTYEEWSNLKE